MRAMRYDMAKPPTTNRTKSTQTSVRSSRTDSSTLTARVDVQADRPEVSTEALSWSQLKEFCLEEVAKQAPGLQTTFLTISTPDGLARFAAAHPEGSSLVVSPEYLLRASRDPDFADKWRAFVKTAAAQLGALSATQGGGVGAMIAGDGTVTVWMTQQEEPEEDAFTFPKPENSLDWLLPKNQEQKKENGLPQVRHYKEKGGRNITEIDTPKGKLRIVFVKKVGYSAGRDLSRLAQLSSVADVRSMMSGVGTAMQRANRDKMADEDEVKAAVAQMKRVLQRARVKINRLQEEKQIDSTRRKAIARRNAQKALQAEAELRRKRAARRAREYGQIHDSENDPNNPGLKHGQNELQISWEFIPNEQMVSTAGSAVVDGVQTGGAAASALWNTLGVITSSAAGMAGDIAGALAAAAPMAGGGEGMPAGGVDQSV